MYTSLGAKHSPKRLDSTYPRCCSGSTLAERSAGQAKGKMEAHRAVEHLLASRRARPQPGSERAKHIRNLRGRGLPDKLLSHRARFRASHERARYVRLRHPPATRLAAPSPLAQTDECGSPAGRRTNRQSLIRVYISFFLLCGAAFLPAGLRDHSRTTSTKSSACWRFCPRGTVPRESGASSRCACCACCSSHGNVGVPHGNRATGAARLV